MKTFETENKITIADTKINKKIYFENIELWNPSLVSYISILLTPIFGSILHLINWKKIKNRKMLFINLAFALLYIPLFLSLLSFLDDYNYRQFVDSIPSYYETLTTLFYFIYWFVWYYFAAKKQTDLMKNKDYIKRKLLKPILIAVLTPTIIIGAVITWFLLMFL